ncbi:MAG: hypothetical protein U1G08_22135 [Verrucomicrobiota bacterium]
MRDSIIWVLARREDLSPEEASRALVTIEEEFWETKAGQKALRDRVERNFAEFIARVPAAALADSGIKRHYKTPEPRQSLRRLVPASRQSLDALANAGNSGDSGSAFEGS